MKALSIMQPWAWLIVNGHKPVENRSWPTRFRGPVLIHAGKKFDGDDDSQEWGWPNIQRPDDFEFGGIVGEAVVVDCVTAHPSPFFCGPYGFVLRDARALAFRPCRGMLGFFTPDFSPPQPKPTKVKSPPDLFAALTGTALAQFEREQSKTNAQKHGSGPRK